MDYPQMMAKMWRGVAMGISTIVGLIAVYIIITTSRFVFRRSDKDDDEK